MPRVKKAVAQVLRETEHLLDGEDVRNAEMLLENGEWGVAFELICEQLHERGSTVLPEHLVLIREAAAQMGLPSSAWKHLAEDESVCTKPHPPSPTKPHPRTRTKPHPG